MQCAGTTAEIGPVDLVFIALKATANRELERLLPPLIGERTALLTLQNGLGNEEFLARALGRGAGAGRAVFCVHQSHCAGSDPASRSRVDFDRRIPAAGLGARAGDCGGFPGRGVEANAVDDLEGERWRKLLWNIPFNGLSIAAGANVAEVLADDGCERWRAR